MADLRLKINELPEELNPAPIDNIAIDGPSTRRTTLQRAADAVRPYSTEAMAREGLNNASVMTPLRVSQAIETLGGQRFATAQQGNKADTAVQPTLTISAGTGLAGGGSLAANREIALNSASIASLALANSAVQPARQVIAGVGLTGGGSLAADRTVSLDATTLASLAKADSAVQPARAISAGTGLTGGGNLSADRTLALNAASVASLAKADSAVQPARAINAGTGLSGGGDLSADRSLSLSAATQASLAKADSAIQAPGGTAGQILAKASSDPNDVGWVNIEGATAVSYGPQSLTLAQQGQARANIGAGIIAGFRNKIINGNFDIWQRGTSLASGTGVRYLADRWYTYSVGSSYVVNRGGWNFAQNVVPGTPTYYHRTDITSVAGANNLVLLRQPIEDVTSLAGRWVTVTFYAWANANRKIWLEFAQAFGVSGGGSEAVQSIGVTEFNLTATPAKFQALVFIPGLAGKTLGNINSTEMTFWLEGGSAHVARIPGISQQGNGTVYISRVSLVEGDATQENDPFAPRHPQQELALCQRYFQLVDVQFSTYASGASFESQHQMLLPVVMRSGPTQAVISPGSFTSNVSSITLQGTSRRALIVVVATATGTLGVYNRLHSLEAEF
jgi:hypothetical protein